jgi:hypothetical protein
MGAAGIEPTDVGCHCVFKTSLRFHIEHQALPVFGGQSVNVIKMIVARSDGKVVLLRGCGDPDVIFRNWSTFFAKNILDFTVVFSRCGIATENSGRPANLCTVSTFESTRVDFRAP